MNAPFKIYHETIDSRIIDHLNAIGYNSFWDIYQDRKQKDFYINLYFNSQGEFLLTPKNTDAWKFEVWFEIDNTEVNKDREYYGRNLKTKKVERFVIFNRSCGSKTLQDLIDEWFEGLNKWLENEQ